VAVRYINVETFNPLVNVVVVEVALFISIVPFDMYKHLSVFWTQAIPISEVTNMLIRQQKEPSALCYQML